AAGGRGPQAVTRAKALMAVYKIPRTLDDAEITEIDDPFAAFAAVVSEAVALKDALASHVAALPSLDITTEKGGEQARAAVQLYERAMDRAGKLLGQWVALGLED